MCPERRYGRIDLMKDGLALNPDRTAARLTEIKGAGEDAARKVDVMLEWRFSRRGNRLHLYPGDGSVASQPLCGSHERNNDPPAAMFRVRDTCRICWALAISKNLGLFQ